MKKRLIGLFCVLALVGVMAFGALGTGAWFTDSKTVDNNSMTIGTLGISTNPTTAAITIANAAPGWNYHDASHWGYDFPNAVIVQNTGTLPLKYRMQAVITSGTYNNALLDETLVSVAKETGGGGVPGVVTTIFTGTLRDLLSWHTIDSNFQTTGNSGWYGNGQRIRVYLAIPTSVGNEIQGQNINFKLVFDATQVDSTAW